VNVAEDRYTPVSNNEKARRATTQWLVRPIGLPLIRRRCLNCPSTRYRAHGRFRVNANHKLLDVWLLALCVVCEQTIKLTVMERTNVRAIDPETLTKFHENDLELTAKSLTDPGVLHRNGISLDWEGAWALRTTAPDLSGVEVIDTSVHFTQRIPIRLVRLLSAGLTIPRAEVERQIAHGRISSTHPLTGNASTDFTFTLRR
jgi:hypothetical protein